MCATCKTYFCEDCGLFHHENVNNTPNNCPGDLSNPHDTILVKITRNVKEYQPTGVSIEKLEQNPKLGRDTSSLKVLNKVTQSKASKKALILDNDEKSNSKEKKSKVLILDDDS
jgi:hypothetical protein